VRVAAPAHPNGRESPRTAEPPSVRVSNHRVAWSTCLVSQSEEDQRPPRDPERMMLFVLSLLVVLCVALVLTRFVMNLTADAGSSMDLFNALS
jgi:hypothetical protein